MLGGVVEPGVDVGLGGVGEGGAALVDPGQELRGDQDVAAGPGRGAGSKALVAGARAGPAQDVPGGERAKERGVGGRAGGQELVEPGLDPVQVLLRSGSSPAWTSRSRR